MYLSFGKGFPCVFYFVLLILLFIQSLVEEARKFSRTASEEAKQIPEKVDPQSLNSIENGFGSKDNQQLVVSCLDKMTNNN